MKPTRIRMAHSLVMNYGLYKKMEIFRAKPATKREMSQFHTDEYVDFLNRVTPDNFDAFVREQAKCEYRDDGVFIDLLSLSLFSLSSFAPKRCRVILRH